MRVNSFYRLYYCTYYIHSTPAATASYGDKVPGERFAYRFSRALYAGARSDRGVGWLRIMFVRERSLAGGWSRRETSRGGGERAKRALRSLGARVLPLVLVTGCRHRGCTEEIFFAGVYAFETVIVTHSNPKSCSRFLNRTQLVSIT